MKLEKFKEKNNKKKFIILFTVCCVFLLAGVFLYTSFAVFTEDKQFNVINGTYQDPGDLYFAVYVDGQITDTVPSKDSGYTLDTEKSSCTNGATITWDKDSWSAVINLSNYSAGNMSRTKCTMYFKEQSFADAILACNDTAANCIKDNASLSNEIATDDPDNNARFIGADPSNYVSFNGELWRIIGVMNNVLLEDGTSASLLKIIRNDSIGSYSFDSGLYVRSNLYSEAAIKDTLNNGPYWNRTSGTCPFQNSAGPGASITTSCDMSSKGLMANSKTFLENVVWYLGSVEFPSSLKNVYIQERSGTDTWTGYVGLIYASDFLYSVDPISSECESVEAGTSCYASTYFNSLNLSSSLMNTLTRANNTVIKVRQSIYTSYSSYMPYDINPTVYLKSNVKIVSGAGVEQDPWVISMS